MNETTPVISTTDETSAEKRAWQTPTMEVFDVETSTLAGAGAPVPIDFGTYMS